MASETRRRVLLAALLRRETPPDLASGIAPGPGDARLRRRQMLAALTDASPAERPQQVSVPIGLCLRDVFL